MEQRSSSASGRSLTSMPATFAPAAAARSRFAVPMPPPAPVTTAVLPTFPSRLTIASGPLEAADQLVVGDAPVVLELLPAAGVQVVLDHRVAECRAQHCPNGQGSRAPRAASSAPRGSPWPCRRRRKTPAPARAAARCRAGRRRAARRRRDTGWRRRPGCGIRPGATGRARPPGSPWCGCPGSRPPWSARTSRPGSACRS